MPSSRTVGSTSSSASRLHSEYSVWRAVIGWWRGRGGSSRRGFAEAEEAHLPRPDQLGHRADRLLDRHVRVDAVLVIEVDRLDAEPLEARLAGRADIIGVAAHAEEAAVLAADVAELGGEEDLVAAAGDGAADQLLVAADAVHVGGVEEGDAASSAWWMVAIDSASSPAAVEFGHAHAAEADRRDFGPSRPQPPLSRAASIATTTSGTISTRPVMRVKPSGAAIRSRPFRPGRATRQ
jgi:hypothetical protein